MERLESIIKILINGDFLKLSEIYACQKVQVKKMPPLPEKRQTKSLVTSIQKHKQKSPEKQRQEEIRANIEKTKKKKAKVAKQLMNNFYSVMDLSKQQFLEDFNYCINPEEKKKRLF